MLTGDRKTEYNREWMAKRRAEWFADKSCVVCGSREGLELDHKDPTQKITHRIWSWAKERREAELAKCQVLCSMHHAEKTRREHLRGERHPRTRLTEAQVLAIRWRHRNGDITMAELGYQYGVTRSTIWDIVHRRVWQHL